jgi:glycosyltransferase involved in cell wall biosynthesis
VNHDGHSELAVIVIGRNEGPRLQRCLMSVLPRAANVVYVDSGSSDESVALAHSLGADVVELDTTIPFTAARARNAGIARARELSPLCEFIQVVDGDCEVVEGWLETATAYLRGNPKVGVVCGRRRERFVNASLYNKLCDMEWDTPIGEADSCGGDAMMRVNALVRVNGYNASIIAGEEPELCLRLRQAGWQIARLDQEMTLHDANLMRFSQWWRRMLRSGHAYAEGRAMHGRHGHCVREVRSILEWAVVLPLLALTFAWFTWGLSLLLLGAYGLLWWRVRRHRVLHGDSPGDASLYANACVVGKFAQLVGVTQYWWNRLRGDRTAIIEYKATEYPNRLRPAEASRT